MTIETKYNIGDMLWVGDYKEPTQYKVVGIKFCKWDGMEEDLVYTMLNPKNNDYSNMVEKYLYPTKEELLKSL